MTAVLLVAIGGGAGALLRYAAQRAFAARTGRPHAGTLLVNLAGTFALGLLLGSPLAADGRAAQLLIGVGFLGGLTTFSTVMAQLTEMLKARRWKAAAGYGLATFGGGLLLAAAGYALGRWI
jgi:Integral membrane protein possibly involved in chromosome condensation